MTFLAPGLAILAAGIGITTIVALHVLRLRRLPQRVPSTLLWRRSVQDLEANVPFQRLRFSWLLLLQLLAVASAAIAAGQPVLEHGAAPAALAIVIDTRARMNAIVDPPAPTVATARTAEGAAAASTPSSDTAGRGAPPPRTRFDLARDAARRTIESLAADDTLVHLVASRARPALVTSGSPRAALDALDRLVATDEGGDPAEAMTLAAQVVPDGEIRWIGDPERARRDNAGISILAAQRGVQEPGVAELLVGAVNSNDGPVEVPLVVSVDGRVMAARVVRLPAPEPGAEGAPGRASVLLRIPISPGAQVEARLESADALPLDDAAWVRFAPAAPIRVAFLGADGPSPSPLLELLQLMDPVRVTTLPCGADRAALASFDLVVADGCVPSIAGGGATAPPSLVFAWPSDSSTSAPRAAGGAAETPPPEQAASTPGATITAVVPGDARATPILQGVPPFSVEIAVPDEMLERIDREPSSRPPLGESAADAAPAPTQRRRLLESADRTIAWIDPRGPSVRFLFPLRATEWTAEPSWVMVMQNAVLWLVGDDGEGVGSPIRTGQPARVLAERRDGSRAWVSAAPSPRIGPIEVRPPDGEPVVHRVSLLDERQSDLRAVDDPPDPRVRESPRDRTGDRGSRPLWPWFAMAALVLLVGEWSLALGMLRRGG